jgi:hypothetical protein
MLMLLITMGIINMVSKNDELALLDWYPCIFHFVTSTSYLRLQY